MTRKPKPKHQAGEIYLIGSQIKTNIIDATVALGIVGFVYGRWRKDPEPDIEMLHVKSRFLNAQRSREWVQMYPEGHPRRPKNQDFVVCWVLTLPEKAPWTYPDLFVHSLVIKPVIISISDLSCVTLAEYEAKASEFRDNAGDRAAQTKHLNDTLRGQLSLALGRVGVEPIFADRIAESLLVHSPGVNQNKANIARLIANAVQDNTLHDAINDFTHKLRLTERLCVQR